MIKYMEKISIKFGYKLDSAHDYNFIQYLFIRYKFW